MVTLDCLQTIQEIKKAFKSSTYPKKDFYDAIADRDYLNVNSVRKEKRKEWSDIDSDILSKYYDFMLFLDEEGQLYYLPAYAIALLEDNSLYDSWVYDTWVQVLNNFNVNILNGEQKKAITKTLKCIKKRCVDCDKEEIEMLIKKFEKFESNRIESNHGVG